MTSTDRSGSPQVGWVRRDATARNDRDEALRSLADATREVIHQLHATLAPVEVLRGLATSLSGLAQILETQPRGRLYEGHAEVATSGSTSGFYDFSPVVGGANPLAPPIDLRVEGDVVKGSGTFGAAYEGPPGCVHGGVISATFDELLGMAQSVTGRPAMTGTLTVRYRSLTPLHTELRLIGQVDEVDGRKVRTSGRMYAGDRLTAEAEAVFVAIDEERLAALVAERRAGADD